MNAQVTGTEQGLEIDNLLSHWGPKIAKLMKEAHSESSRLSS